MSVLTMSLLGVYCGRAFSAQDVDAHRYGLKMPRIHARRVATKMVKRESRRDRPDEQLVGDAIRRNRPEVRIPVLTDVAAPRPTLVNRPRLDKR